MPGGSGVTPERAADVTPRSDVTLPGAGHNVAMTTGSAAALRARLASLTARPDAWLLLDTAIAIVAVAVIQATIVRSEAGWDFATPWVVAFAGLAPLTLAVRRVMPVVSCVGLAVAGVMSYAALDSEWAMAGCLAVALYSVSAWHRFPVAVRGAVAALVLVPLVAIRSWYDLFSVFYPHIYQPERPLPDGSIEGAQWGIPSDLTLRIADRPVPWVMLVLLTAAWCLGLMVRRYRRTSRDARSLADVLGDLRGILSWRPGQVLVDSASGVVLSVLVFLDIELGWRIQEWWSAPTWMVAVIGIAPISLAVRRLWPEVPTVLLGAAALIFYWQAEEGWSLLIALAVALYSLGSRRRLVWALPVGAFVLGALPMVAAVANERLMMVLFPVLKTKLPLELVPVVGRDYQHDFDSLLNRPWPPSLSLILVLPLSLGILARRGADSAAQAAELRRRTEEQDEAQVVLTERARIARDLHDVIAHHANLIVIQAETGPDLVEKGDADVLQGFRRIGDTGRRALGELDRMLSALRAADGVADPELAPQPGLADLRRLVTDVAGQGPTVDLDISGDVDAVPSGHQLTGYRIVQEALTNVVRHAGARNVTVAVAVAEDGLSIEVTDDGRGFDPPGPDRAGRGGRHGLAGMRERARIHDGTLSVTSGSGAGTTISAWLPIT